MTVPILSPAQLNEVLPQGYMATITRIPGGLPSQDPLRESFDDRSIDVAKTMGSIWFHVTDPANGALVATAVFAADAKAARCDTIDVMDAYQRKGVGIAIYTLASREFGSPVVPSAILSDEARMFWGSRTHISWP